MLCVPEDNGCGNTGWPQGPGSTDEEMKLLRAQGELAEGAQ